MENPYATQTIYIVRHGDKFSSYPPCPGMGGFISGKPCYDEKLMGDNPPLTECGIRQANATAQWLADRHIKTIVVSPFTRTLQTALPLAKRIGKQMNVEYLLSEAMQPDGPYRAFNVDAPGATDSQLEEVLALWNLDYGSPPIQTPENNTLYLKRVKRAAKTLKARFPQTSGTLALFTHATTSFSIAYGLCHGSDSTDTQVEDFVKHQDAIAPAGVIEVQISGNSCVIKQTNNVAQKTVDCGDTPAFKCNFSDYPSWYWNHTAGEGPGRCH